MPNDLLKYSDSELESMLAQQSLESYSTKELQAMLNEPDSDVEYQNIIGKSFNVPGAAIASSMLGKGYMEGALRPSNVPQFSELAAKKASDIAGRLPSAIAPSAAFVLSSLGQSAGMAVDPRTYINPLSAISLGAMTTPGKIATQAIGGTKIAQEFKKFLTKERRSPLQYSKDLFTRPRIAKEEAEAAKFALRQKTTEIARVVSKEVSAKQTIARENYKLIENSYDDLSDNLKKQIVVDADKEAINLQKELPELFAKKSVEYGNRLENAVKGKNISVAGDDIVKGLEDTLIERGVMRFDDAGELIVSRAPMSSAEKRIYQLYKGTKKQLLDNPEAKIDIEDLLRTQKAVQPQFGKTWTPDDHLNARVAENISDKIEDSVKEIKELRSEFRPYLQWKRQAIKEFQPFSSKYETGRATKLISKRGTSDINPDEERLLAELDKQIGRKVGEQVEKSQSKLRSASARKEAIRDASEKVIVQARKDAADVIAGLRKNKNLQTRDIDLALDKLVEEYKSSRIKWGVAAGIIGSSIIGQNLWKYFFRREIYSGIHGGY